MDGPHPGRRAGGGHVVFERAERIEVKDRRVVLLDTPDADGAAIFAETVPTGDPTFAGLLAGVPSRLAVFHVVEPAIKAQIQSDAYATNLAVIEDLAEVGAICSCVAAVRASAPR